MTKVPTTSEMFANVQLFGVLKKVGANKNGQEMQIACNLNGNQFGVLAELAQYEGGSPQEIAVTITPSRRGTVWEPLINPHRITAESAEFVGDLAGLLSYNAMDAARHQLQAINTEPAFEGWDDPEKLLHFSTEMVSAIERGEYSRMLALAAIVFNLQKPEYVAPEQTDQADGEDGESLFDGPDDIVDCPKCGFSGVAADYAWVESGEAKCPECFQVFTPHIVCAMSREDPPVEDDDLDTAKLKELRAIAKTYDIPQYSKMGKAELIQVIRGRRQEAAA